MNTFREAFWVLAIGLIACFAFFFALGAITAEAVGLMVVMGVLTALWLVHAWRVGHDHGSRDPRLVHGRERRGF